MTSALSPAAISEHALIAGLWSGVAISLIFLIVRIWIRLKVFRQFRNDDPFVLTAFVLSVAHAAVWTAISDDIYFNIALTNGRLKQIPPDVLHRMERLSYGALAAYCLTFTGLWSVKLSLIMFFWNFGNKLHHQRIAWYTVLGFCLASYAVCIGTIDYRCLTSKGTKMLSVCSEARTMKFELITLRLSTALDVLTDVSIILLMTNILWRIHLRLWTKLALGGIFSLTIFVIIIAIIRVAIASSNGTLDLSWLVLWQGVELSVGIIVVSLASFRILYTSIQNTSRRISPQSYNACSDTAESSRTKNTSIGWTELPDRSSCVADEPV